MARRQARRNLLKAGEQTATYTLRTAEKATVGLFRWAATDHYGISRPSVPNMGFLDEITLFLIRTLVSIVGAILSALWIVFLLFVVLPYLLFGV